VVYRKTISILYILKAFVDKIFNIYANRVNIYCVDPSAKPLQFALACWISDFGTNPDQWQSILALLVLGVDHNLKTCGLLVNSPFED